MESAHPTAARACHPSHSSGYSSRVFLLQLFIFQLVSRSPSCQQSITITSSARQQPNVTAPAPAAHPAFSGKGSTVGPPGCTHAGALSARGWKAQVTSPTQWTTYELVFQAQNQPTVETLKPADWSPMGDLGRGFPQLPPAQPCSANAGPPAPQSFA